VSLLAANWKMNLIGSEARALARSTVQVAKSLTNTKVWLAPSTTLLAPVIEESRGSNVRVGAQNVFWEKAGAFTGEVSVPQLLDLGCDFSLVGHSERRHQFGDSPEGCIKRAVSAVTQGLPVLFCLGETLAERTKGDTLKVLESQLAPLITAFTLLSPALLTPARMVPPSSSGTPLLTLAYEPVWAIGTGKAASLNDISEAHSFLYSWWASHTNNLPAPIILYGGSVSPGNFADILSVPHVGGALVGKASLTSESFAQLAQIAEAAAGKGS